MVSLRDIFRTCRFCNSLGKGVGGFSEVIVCGFKCCSTCSTSLSFLSCDAASALKDFVGSDFPINFAEAAVIPTTRMALAENATSTTLGRMAKMMCATCCHAKS